MSGDDVKNLIDAANAFLALNKTYRGKPIGAPYSQKRVEQEAKMLAEDALLAAIKKLGG